MCVVALLVSCKNQSLSDEVSRDKFIPFALDNVLSYVSMLINHVRVSDLPDGKLRIAHRYDGCSFSDNAEAHIRQATINMIDIWLTPLRKLDADIVKKENISVSSSAQNYQLEIFWHCNKYRRSGGLNEYYRLLTVGCGNQGA